jgi:predicted RNA-binding protein YlxR (DUF448 family)
LLRVVAARVDGVLVALPDAGARLPGRGAWLHPELACLDLAERRRAFPRALRQQGPLEAGAVREHLQQLSDPPQNSTDVQRTTSTARAPQPPSTHNGSGSASDGHPMSSQR